MGAAWGRSFRKGRRFRRGGGRRKEGAAQRHKRGGGRWEREKREWAWVSIQSHGGPLGWKCAEGGEGGRAGGGRGENGDASPEADNLFRGLKRRRGYW